MACRALVVPSLCGAALLAAALLLGIVALAAAATTFVLIAGDFLFGLRFTLLFFGVNVHPFGMTGGIVESFIASMVLRFVSYWAWMATAFVGAGAIWAGESWWTER